MTAFSHAMAFPMIASSIALLIGWVTTKDRAWNWKMTSPIKVVACIVIFQGMDWTNYLRIIVPRKFLQTNACTQTCACKSENMCMQKWKARDGKTVRDES